MLLLLKKILFLFYLCSLSILVFPITSQNTNLEKVSLQLKWHHQFQFAGYYVAKYKGYYKDEGLDVELIEGGPQATYEDILSGKVNFGVGDSKILLARMENRPIVALAAIFQHTPDGIITRTDSRITVPIQLIHKKIMLGEPKIPPAIQAIFLKEGIPLSSLTTIPNDHDIDSFLNRKVDALLGYVTNEPYQIEQNGVKTQIFHPYDYGIDMYGDMLFTSENEVENNKERVEKFLRASLKGWQYAMDHIEETADLILNTPEIIKSNRITKNFLLYEGKTLDSLILSNVIPIGHINPDRLQRTAKLFQNLGLFKGEYSLNGFVFETEQKVDIRWKRYVVIGSLTILPIIFISTFLIIILRKLVRARTNELLENKKTLESLNFELEKSEKKYKDLIENSKDIIFSLDADGRIITINRAVTEILKYKVKDLIGKKLGELVYSSGSVSQRELFLEIFKYTIQEVIEKKEIFTFNTDFTTKIGEPIEISVTLQYVQLDSDFIIIGTASILKEDELSKFCEEEFQVFKIRNFLTHVDAICHRLPNAALKYSNQDTVYNIRMCLREMLLNAIEHGNLNINFDEKTQQQENGDYLQFLIARQKNPLYTNKFVTIEYKINPTQISFRITDEGEGFDHKKMMRKETNDKSLENLGHGRGLIMTRDFFDKIEYNEKGNSVYLVKYFKK